METIVDTTPIPSVNRSGTATPPTENGLNPQAGHLPTTQKRQPWKEFIHVVVGPAHNFEFGDGSEGHKGDNIRLLEELDDKIASG